MTLKKRLLHFLRPKLYGVDGMWARWACTAAIGYHETMAEAARNELYALRIVQLCRTGK